MMITMPSLSDMAELLFWTPASVDVMLLVTTFSLFHTRGAEWYLQEGVPPSRRIKKGELNAQAWQAVSQIWEVTMIAYAAYGVLLPLCFVWAGWIDHSFRLPFCAVMTILMGAKVALFHKHADLKDCPEDQAKVKSLYYFDLPCYGGYVLWSVFFKN